ncbi:MAG: DUF2510 domain-containing protein [Cellulomonas sp.]|nr:DUF2510 domain-containing protein [Cellulomonas sp.]MCR6649774.1 DUF2510 domain-containing protein [Cellulomonas sp.]
MSTTPAGWYPDPAGSPNARFWDGEAWTSQLRGHDGVEVPAPDPELVPVLDPEPADEAKRRPRRALFLIAGAAVIVIAAVVVLVITQANKPSRLQAAFDECGMEKRVGAEITDDGHTVLLDQKGEEDADGLDIIEVGCFLYAVDVPSSVSAQMDSTRALDGRQSAEFDGIKVSWVYHPDSGIDMIFED